MRQIRIPLTVFVGLTAVFVASLMPVDAAIVDALRHTRVRQTNGTSGTIVSGRLTVETGQAAVQRVLLIRVRLVDLLGAEIQSLPPRGTAIVDADVKAPVASSMTDTEGRFTFGDVKPGRYSVAIANSKTSGGETLVRRENDAFDTLVFDVMAGKPIDLGIVRAKKEK